MQGAISAFALTATAKTAGFLTEAEIPSPASDGASGSHS